MIEELWALVPSSRSRLGVPSDFSSVMSLLPEIVYFPTWNTVGLIYGLFIDPYSFCALAMAMVAALSGSSGTEFR